MLTNSLHAVLIGPPTLAASKAEMKDFLADRRKRVEMALRKRVRYGEFSLSKLELELVETARDAEVVVDLHFELERYAQSAEDPVIEAIRAMMLEDAQIDELVEWFVDFWTSPSGEYVCCRPIALGDQEYQLLYVGCAPDCDDHESNVFVRFYCVLLNGLGTAVGLQ